jgi:hypothetical protein
MRSISTAYSQGSFILVPPKLGVLGDDTGIAPVDFFDKGGGKLHSRPTITPIFLTLMSPPEMWS